MFFLTDVINLPKCLFEACSLFAHFVSTVLFWTRQQNNLKFIHLQRHQTLSKRITCVEWQIQPIKRKTILYSNSHQFRPHLNRQAGLQLSRSAATRINYTRIWDKVCGDTNQLHTNLGQGNSISFSSLRLQRFISHYYQHLKVTCTF